MATAAKGVALVTGAAARIGRAIALDLARQGWEVALHCHRNLAGAEAAAAEIAVAGGKAVVLQADLSGEHAAAALVPRAAAALGPLTCLINNAAVFEDDTVESVTAESWARHLAVNLRAPFVLTQAFAAQLPAGATGNVINMLDQRVWNLTPHFTSYTVSKSALWTLTRTLALGLAPRIRVNGIGPGPTLPSPRQTSEHFAHQRSATPLGRGTTPDEICEAVRFILEAPALTGQMIALDGGQHLDWSPLGGGPSISE